MGKKKNNTSIELAIDQILHESTQRDRSYARKKYRWHAQYSLDRADGIDQHSIPITDELENLFLDIEDRRALYAALQRLSSLQRRRLLMRYADRLTYSEIARREGVAPRVAQRSIERALVKTFIHAHHLPDVTFHSLRHSSVTYKLALNDGNIKLVQGDTGHASSKLMLNTYAEIFDQSRKELAVRFEENFYAALQP